MDSPREEMFSRDSGVEVRFIIRLHIIQVNRITSDRIQVDIIQVMTLQIFLATPTVCLVVLCCHFHLHYKLGKVRRQLY